MDNIGDLSKLASNLGRDTAVGATGGATVAALLSLFRSRPSLKQSIMDVLKGAGAGAALGTLPSLAQLAKENVRVAGHTRPTSMTEELPEPGFSRSNKPKMNLGGSALAGLAPGLGPALHGGFKAGPGQAVGSGMSSLAAGTVAAHPFVNSSNPKVRVLGLLAGLLGSSAGSVGAAAAGNSLRS